MDKLQTQTKALVAAAVGFLVTWAGAKYGIKLDSPEAQAGLVTAILYFVTYFSPNKQV